MARPQKFRHQREDLADPKIAEKLGRLVIEIEDLRSQKSKIDDQLAAAFDAVDDAGFEKKYVRKVVALRAKEDGVRREEEDGLESYEFAIEKGVSLAHARRKPANDQFDPLTGEFIDDNEASDGSPSVSAMLAARVAEESAVSHSSETAIEQPEAHGSSPCIVAREANRPATYGQLVTAGKTALHSDQPLKGGDEDPRAVGDPTSKTGEGAASALPAVGYFIEDVPPSGMKRLPYAGCFPELTKAEYEKLEMDIADNGVDVSIIRQGDVIIDGWHRFIIARKYGLNYPIHQIELERDVLLDVIERQRASRNFTPAQEKKIAADLAKEFPRRADEIMAAFGLAEALEAAE